MLKKDLLEKIKEIEDDKDIDEIILNNGFAKPLKDIDGFNELLASNKEIQEKLDAMEKEKTRAERVSKFKDTLTEKKIPGDLINFILGEDDETTNANITLFENSMKSYIDNQVNERLNGGYKPPKDEFNNDDSIEKMIASAMGVN